MKGMRRSGNRELSDSRILGKSEFVQRIIKEAETSVKRQLRFEGEPQKIDALMAKMCKKEKVSVQELKSGSRRKDVSRARSLIALALVKTHGMALADVARTVGVSTSAISKIVKRMSL